MDACSSLQTRRGNSQAYVSLFLSLKKQEAASLLTGYMNYIGDLCDALENNRNSQHSALLLRIKMKTEVARLRAGREH